MYPNRKIEPEAINTPEDIKELLDEFGVGIDCVAKNEVVTDGLSWHEFCQLVSFMEENGISRERMIRYDSREWLHYRTVSRYKLGIEVTIDTNESGAAKQSKRSHDRCPVCGSMMLNWPSELVDGEDGTIRLPTECMACGAEWLQRYIYDGDEEIETGME